MDFEDGANINFKMLISINKPISYKVYKAVDISVNRQRNGDELTLFPDRQVSGSLNIHAVCVSPRLSF